MASKDVRVAWDALKQFSQEVFARVGFTPEGAEAQGFPPKGAEGGWGLRTG